MSWSVYSCGQLFQRLQVVKALLLDTIGGASLMLYYNELCCTVLKKCLYT